MRKTIKTSLMLTSITVGVGMVPFLASALQPTIKPSASQPLTEPSALGSPVKPAAERCLALAHMAIKDTNLLSATVVPDSAESPAHCRVLGFVRPAINFELRLPVDSWNQKFLMAGCGGFCGGMLNQSPVFLDALKRGYAVVVTDTGHWGAYALDARWAYKNPAAKDDYSWRGVNETTRVSKLLSRTFYDAEIRYSYYDGCSNGGRQGLMEAQRFPDNYDGVVAGAPARDAVGLTNLFTWTLQADRSPAGHPILNATKVDLLRKAVAAECGDANGLIEDPRQCKFKPAKLACGASDDGSCLTKSEVAAAERLYTAPQTSSGKLLFPSGVPFGSEPFWMPGNDPAALMPLKLGSKGLVGFILSDPEPGETYDPAVFDFDRDVTMIERIGRSITPSADLRAFAKRGGKLILWQGWSDPMVPPATTIEYYDEVRATLGSTASASARLFMVPGLGHCSNPAGSKAAGFDVSDFDPLTALEKWVEKGEAPDAISAISHASSGKIRLARKLCPYPSRSEFGGKGDRGDPANWKCSAATGRVAAN